MKRVEWMGSKTCDFCGKTCENELIDGMTVFGPWAVMCPTCFKANGIRIAPGYGQRYKLDKDGKLMKVEG